MLIPMLSILALSVALTPVTIAQVNDEPVLIGDIPRDFIARPTEERVLYFQSWRDNEAWSSRIMSLELVEDSLTGMYQRYRVQTRTIADAPEGASVEENAYEVHCTDGIAGSVIAQNGYTVTVRGDVDFPSNAELGGYALHRIVCLGSAPDWAL
ncbi:MAG: hypothetical protein HC873_04490 [Leptolyngbyaceae cyanobacterium SL_1_1]|nr:hypothetical protein [Leptolyngbyaceae cyanobacterium RM1_1_2]NJO09035.1 hypothetical protein [Leptolyngbyaceae cyanobacterium SL_1_1]